MGLDHADMVTLCQAGGRRGGWRVFPSHIRAWRVMNTVRMATHEGRLLPVNAWNRTGRRAMAAGAAEPLRAKPR